MLMVGKSFLLIANKFSKTDCLVVGAYYKIKRIAKFVTRSLIYERNIESSTDNS